MSYQCPFCQETKDTLIEWIDEEALFQCLGCATQFPLNSGWGQLGAEEHLTEIYNNLNKENG